MSIDVKLKHSATPGKVPGGSDLTAGEVAINTADEVAYIKNADGDVVALTGAGSIPSYPNVDDGDGATLDARYVKVVGDDMTGNLTLGTDKITLNASTGTIKGNYVEVGDYNSENSTAIYNGNISIARDGSGDLFSGYGQLSSTNPVFSVDYQGTIEIGDTPNARLVALSGSDGSSQFAGDMAIGTTGSFTPSTPAITLNANGNAYFQNRDVSNSSGQGVVLENGGLYVQHASTALSTDHFIRCTRGKVTGGGSGEGDTFRVVSDGSLFVGGNQTLLPNGSPTAPNISLNADGSIDAAGGAAKINNDGALVIDKALPGTAFGVLEAGVSNAFIQSNGDSFFKTGVKVGSTYAAPNIELNADGSITAAGQVTSGADPSSGAGNGAILNQGGVVKAGRSEATDVVWEGLLQGTTAATSSIYASGSAEFKGDVEVGDKNVVLYADGNAIFKDNVNIRNLNGGLNSPTTPDATWAGLTVADNRGNPNFAVYGDGSAEFKGDVNVGSRVDISPFGYVTLYNGSGSNKVFKIYQGDSTSTDERVSITAGGSASFVGDVGARFVVANEPNPVQVGTGCFQAQLAGTTTARINADGSGSFAGGDIALKNEGTFGAKFEVYRDGIAVSVRSMTDRVNDAISLFSNGDATFAGTVTATVVPPSDARFKENITPAKPQLADVVALGGILKNYDWNDQAPLNEEIRSQRQLGLIAQEAAEVCPALVKDIHRTKQGAVITPEEIIPAVVEPAYTIPAVTKEIPNPKASKQGETITIEVKPAEEVPEQVITPEQVIPATYEVLDDSYKGISTDALIMKLIGAVTELKAELDVLKGS